MRTSSPSFSAAAASLLAVAIVAVSLAAQETQPALQAQAPAVAPAPRPAGGPPGGWPRDFPAPTNLKVLPKTLTGNQVRDVMEGWSRQLGVHCNACHTADPKNLGPNGRPRMNFPDDSKPEKNAARLMFKMTTDINDNYVSMVDMDHDEQAHEDHAGHKVTCGTCHRGHLKPEAYVPPPEHDGPPPPPTGAR